MLNSLKLFIQNIFPQILITRLIGWYANSQAGWLTKLGIDLFVKYYNVDMSESKKSDTSSYRTFNDFFTRHLRDEVRPINTDPNILIIPVDGIISQLGKIEEGKILQAKNQNYSLEALLAGNYIIADQFKDGVFVTIYISPRNYHRVHMPCNGILREMIYVPGNLFSVNHLAVQNIPNLFARNERVICLFDTEFGPVVQILVGSTIVGNIETVWLGKITPPREGIIKRWTWPDSENDGAIVLLKGQEMGCFRLGSTVINLFSRSKVNLIETLKNLSTVKIGQAMAISTESSVSEINGKHSI